MVFPAKIFEIKEEVDLDLIIGKLKNFREEETYQIKKTTTTNLITEILDLQFQENSIYGVFSKDFIDIRFYRRKPVETAITEESPFWIRRNEGRFFLIVSAPSVARGVKKLLTNYIANKLSKILFITPHAIVEVKIPHEILKELHESNPEATKLIWFDDIDIPGVEKLCLSGSDLADTNLYRSYIEHGTIWYVVFEVQKRGIVVGITRNSVVTLFSKTTSQEFINYISEDILKLIE